MADVHIDQASLRLLLHALRDEADGREMRRDLIRNLRAAAQPALVAVRTAVLSMPSQGTGEAPSLRAKIAAGTKVHIRSSGRRAGVSIQSHRKGMPRRFWHAPKRLNSRKPWRHPVFGNRNVWVSQVSRRPGWFDDTLRAQKPAFVRAAAEALENVADRISRKSRG